MAKTSRERQAAYRERHLKTEDATKSRLNILVSDKAMLALKRLTKHYGTTQADMLEQVLLEEQRRVIAGMSGPEVEAYHDAVTV